MIEYRRIATEKLPDIVAAVIPFGIGLQPRQVSQDCNLLTLNIQSFPLVWPFPHGANTGIVLQPRQVHIGARQDKHEAGGKISMKLEAR